MVDREHSTFTVLCDGCGGEFGSVASWLDHIPKGEAVCNA